MQGKIIRVLEIVGVLPTFLFAHEMESEEERKGRTRGSYTDFGLSN